MTWRWLAALLFGLPLSMLLARAAIAVLPWPETHTSLAVMQLAFPVWVGLMALAFWVSRRGRKGNGNDTGDTNDRLRRFLHLHSWAGILAGAALFIAFYAGAITVFAEELRHWERQPVAAAVQGPDEAQALLEAFRARHPDATDFWLLLAGPGEPLHQLHWDTAGPDGTEVEHEYVLDADGQLRGDVALPGLVEFIFRLHYTAGLPHAWGEPLLGVLSMLYGLALVSGVVMYLPRFVEDVFAMRRGRNAKRTWLDLHNVVGVLSLPFHVVFAWTGALLGIGLLVVALYQPLFDKPVFELVRADFELVPPPVASGTPAQMLPVPEVLARASTAVPELVPESISFLAAGDANAVLEVYGTYEGRTLGRAAGIAFGAVDGAVLRVDTPLTDSPGNTLLRGLLALHYGNFGQMAVKWLYFLLAMGGALLFYTGNLLWIETRRRRRDAVQPAHAVWLAKLTVGVCIGSVAGLSAAMVAEHALPALLADRDVWQRMAYYATFGACVLGCLVARPATGAFWSLIAASVLTACVPVVDLLMGAGWTGPGAGSRMGVDLVAVVLAAVFARAAVATRRRASQGQPNSVWADGGAPSHP